VTHTHTHPRNHSPISTTTSPLRRERALAPSRKRRATAIISPLRLPSTSPAKCMHACKRTDLSEQVTDHVREDTSDLDPRKRCSPARETPLVRGETDRLNYWTYKLISCFSYTVPDPFFTWIKKVFLRSDSSFDLRQLSCLSLEFDPADAAVPQSPNF